MVDNRCVVRLGMPSEEKPNMTSLSQFLTEYCGQWRFIGYKLGLSDSLLSMIHSDNSTQERDCFRITLKKWLDQDPRPTWSTLELAITNARREANGLNPLQEMPVQQPSDQQPMEDRDMGQDRETTLTSDALSDSFSRCVENIKEILLTKCKDKLEACKNFCLHLTISGSSNVLLFSNEQMVKINKCTSFGELFVALRGKWNCMEYSTLKSFVKISSSKEAEEELTKYERFMCSYHGMKCVSEKHLSNIEPEDYENYFKLEVVIDEQYDNLTQQRFIELRSFVFKYIGIKERIALPYFKYFFKSPLHLEWYIPVQAISHVIKMVRLNKKVLTEKSIILIKVGDKCILDVRSSKLPHSDTSKIDGPTKVSVSSFLISKEHSHMICPSCKQLFRNPKYLRCHHSYCEECLEKIQVQSTLICTECRQETIVTAGGVKDLPNNYFMNNLVNKLIFDHKLENETELRCEECDEDDSAVVFCIDCKLFLCFFCKEAHKYNKSCSSHNLISLTELRSKKDLIQSKSKFPTCQEHDLELEYYCETCEKLVCVQCKGEHVHHKCDVVKKFVDKCRTELQEATASLETMIEGLSKLHNSIKNVKKAIVQQHDEISKEIDLYYDEVIENLLKQKQQVKQQVHDTVLQKEKALTNQLEDAISLQENIINVKSIKDMARSDQEVISTKYELDYSLVRFTKMYEKLGKRPIESVNTEVTPTNEPLPQIVKHFATIDSLSFKVKDFSNSVQCGKTVTLELNAKDIKGNYFPKGGCKVTTELESGTGEMIATKIIDHDNGTYTICFVAQQVGEIKLSVFVNRQEIKESPFMIMVMENIVPKKIITNCDFSFDQLWGIACSNNGTWAASDLINNCVHVFDSQDNLIMKIGSEGSKNGQFRYPIGVAFDDNNKLYVVDSHNHRVQKFDTHGNYLLQFGVKGTGTGQLNYPIAITAHLDKVYVADRLNNRVSVFQNNGKFHSIIGQRKLSQYFDLTINIDDEILVADWGHHWIYTFTLDGHYINSITLHKGIDRLGLSSSCSITTDSNRFILITDTSMHKHCIFIFDKIGNCKNCFESQFKLPCGISVGQNGNIYVSDTGNKRVLIFPECHYS